MCVRNWAAPVSPREYQAKCLRSSRTALRGGKADKKSSRCSSAAACRSAAVGATDRSVVHERCENVADEPGIAIAAATDHDSVAASLSEHGQSIVCRVDIPAADNGHGKGFFQSADLVPVGVAAEPLRPGAWMQGYRICPFRCGNGRNLQVIDRMCIPAGANLDGQRKFGPFAHRRKQSALTRSGSRIRALPAPERTTLCTGQPRFRSSRSPSSPPGRPPVPVPPGRHQRAECPAAFPRRTERNNSRVRRPSRIRPLLLTISVKDETGAETFHHPPDTEGRDAGHGREKNTVFKEESTDLHGRFSRKLHK